MFARQRTAPNLGYFVEVCKRPGYRSRDFGATLMRGGVPVFNAPKLLPCTLESCPNVEKPEGVKFKGCSYCLTIYCSAKCHKADWKTHKTWCKHNAYKEQLDKFSLRLPEEASGIFTSREVYLEHWDKWIATKEMKKVLAWCELDVADLRARVH